MSLERIRPNQRSALSQPRSGRILPRCVVDAVGALVWEDVAHGASDYPEWLKIEHRLHERLVQLLNARAGSNLALVKNTFEAFSFVAFGLDWREDNQVVINNREPPSNRVVWEALRPCGVEVVEVGPAGDDPEGALLVTCNPRTRLLSINATQCANDLCSDLEHIDTGCRHRGMLFCIDAIQQLDALPSDVQTYDRVFAMANEYKWILGPEGLGVPYRHPEQRERLVLHEYDWYMLRHVLDYKRRDWRPARSTRHFECSSPNMLGAVALEASLGLLEEVGTERASRNIAERVQRLQDGLSGVPGIHLHSSWNPSRRAGILTLSLGGQDSQTLFETFRQERVICTRRGGGIHFSLHFYTSSTVIDDTLTISCQVVGTQVFRDGEDIPNLFKKLPALSGRPTDTTSTERYWRVVSLLKYPASEGTEECVPLFRS